jgi:hypothetical protein
LSTPKFPKKGQHIISPIVKNTKNYLPNHLLLRVKAKQTSSKPMEKLKYHLISAFALLSFFSCQPKSNDNVGTEIIEVEKESGSENRPSPLQVKEGQVAGKTIKVQYGSPAVKGRTIWGDLVPYNVVWRTGANEATFIEVSQDIMVEGQTLKTGKYSIFTIPKETGKWTLIFNSDWNLEHGHFQYDEKNDVLRVEVTPNWEAASTEKLSIDIESPGLVIRWEKMKLPIKVE